MRETEFLSSLIGKKIYIEFENGDYLIGKMVSYDLNTIFIETESGKLVLVYKNWIRIVSPSTE
jgi:LSM domain.